MADIDLKTETPDATLPSTGFLFGADSQAAASPSVYSTQAVATALLGSTSLTGATETTSKPLLDLSQTWNASGVTFTGMRFNVPTDSSAAGSLLMDLQVGGSSRFSVGKTGEIFLSGTSYRVIPNTSFSVTTIRGGAVDALWAGNNGFGGAAAGANGWFALGSSWSGVSDTVLGRNGVANLRLGLPNAASPVAQTLSVQSVVAGTSNTAGANLTITGSQGTGTGAGGSIIFQVAPAGSSGTAQNALSTALTIDSTSKLTLAGTTIDISSGSSARGIISVGGSNLIDIYQGSGWGTGRAVRIGGVLIPLMVVGPYLSLSSDGDTNLFRDAANTLALRNGGTSVTPIPQTFNVYNFWQDASNYERLNISWSANIATIQTQGAGSGSNRPLKLNGSGGSVVFQTGGFDRWQVGPANHFLASVDNTYDIGAIGASRPRTIYIGTTLNLGGTSHIAATNGQVYITSGSETPTGGSSFISSTNVSGALVLGTSNTTSLRISGGNTPAIQIGGTTSSFPALKRSSTVLQARLADDSDFAPLQGQLRTHNAYTAGAPTATGYIVLYDSTGTAYKVPAEAL